MKKHLMILIVTVMVFGESYADYIPGKTLSDDLAVTTVNLVGGYSGQHPRLLFYSGDINGFKTKAAANSALWQKVISHADKLSSVPSSSDIQNGNNYYRIEYILSGALAYIVTDNATYKNNAINWMKAYCQESTWWADTDLGGGWDLYYISLAYDILYSQISDPDKVIIRTGLMTHARSMYTSVLPPQDYRYDQNHRYIPTIGLAAVSFALIGDVGGDTTEINTWIKLSYALLKRCRYVMGNDGYYFEEFGYWGYAFNWHVRYADMLARATGEDAFDLPIFKKNHNFTLNFTLFSSPYPYFFDLGDSSYGSESRPPTSFSFGWAYSMLYNLAGKYNDSKIKAVADKMASYDVYSAYDMYDPGMYFLWHCPGVASDPLDSIPPYYYFADHDVVSWRSSWDKDATAYMFKCGPPEGHSATSKLDQMDDWRMNSGHVHPDIGAFWIYAKGAYLAFDTGYTAAKCTDDHNTLLVDGVGQGQDNFYWVYGFGGDVPKGSSHYAPFNSCSIKKEYLSKDYGYALGDFGSAYTALTSAVSLKRHIVMKKNYLIVFDDISGVAAHKYTWLLHSDYNFTKASNIYTTINNNVKLLTHVLLPSGFTDEIGPTYVQAGTNPGTGTKTQRGYQLKLETPDSAVKTNFLTVLFPAGATDPTPTTVELVKLDGTMLEIRIVWSAGTEEKMALNLNWQPTDATGPLGDSLPDSVTTDPLKNVRRFPNPFNPKLGTVKIDRLPANCTVQIYSISGALLRALNETDFGNLGVIEWDGRNSIGEYAGRGVYTYIITDDKGNKKIGKIALIK